MLLHRQVDHPPNRRWRPAARLAGLGLAFTCASCASVVGSRQQLVQVSTQDRNGTEVRDADCELANDEGKWHVTTPGSVEVHRSNKDLFVYCRKAGIDDGMVTVVSGLGGAIWGNVLVGGGVGALVDHGNGSAYSYPVALQVVMGEKRQIDDRYRATGADAPH